MPYVAGQMYMKANTFMRNCGMGRGMIGERRSREHGGGEGQIYNEWGKWDED